MYYKELDVSESKHNGTCFSGKFLCVGETISKDLVVKCPVCSEDPELFGDGLFVMPKCDLVKGAIPCGCSKKPIWSDEQFKIKINRIIKENNINTKVLSIVGETKKTKRVNFICEIHGNYDKSLTHALGGVNGVVCPDCIDRLKIKDEDIDVVKTKFNIPDYIKITRSDKFINKNKKDYLNIYCPVCASDIYGLSGTCDGNFTVATHQFMKGKLTCRCYSKPILTKEQNLIRARNILVSVGKQDDIIGYDGIYKGTASKLLRYCTEHGEYKTSYKDLMRDLCGCPKCAGNEYNEAYINVIGDKDSPIALKFGISNRAEKRIIKQKQGSIYSVGQLGVWKFDNTDSCKESEIDIKRKIETSYLSKSEFADGYTETCHPDNLQTIINTYESFGGILIS